MVVVVVPARPDMGTAATRARLMWRGWDIHHYNSLNFLFLVFFLLSSLLINLFVVGNNLFDSVKEDE